MYYNVKTQFSMDDDNGKLKKISELYVIQAVSPTDADAIAHKEYGSYADFKVTAISETKIIDIYKQTA